MFQDFGNTQDLRYLSYTEYSNRELQSIGYKRKTISKKETGETVVEERYYLCSIKQIAELFGIAVRRHWNIENGLHRVLDIVFKSS